MINLPELFISRTKSFLGSEYAAFEQALNLGSPVSVRVNDKLNGYKPSDNNVPWCETGFYLDERPRFTADPLLHAGVYYVQEASSMFLKQVVDVFLKDAVRVLDLCAAPGGKSTLLLQYLSDDALLVSNEFVRSRAMILTENIIKWGNTNVVVTNNAPDAFGKMPDFFDAIVVDAPCSGEGMFRKDAGAIAEWSVQNVQQCAMRQKTILRDVWDSLKDGGVLVYSTCTYNREENEDNVAWACWELGARCMKMDVSLFDGIVETEYGYRFYPHKIKGEGFFIAVLRKEGSAIGNKTEKEKRKKHRDSFADKSGAYNADILDADNYVIREANQQVMAFYRKHFADNQALYAKLHCLLNGVLLAEIKGKDLIPTHHFALSKIINRDSFERVELDYQSAIAYLRRESIMLPGVSRGHVLVCYEGQVLGWVKNLGDRANNLYPQHWRIRMHL
jgi:16S rRNA C967 or C1407 C5-methylase (RsmB/RsmF family)/NOL1/NOP2/fmu family ribosome biogenesis protein